MWQEMGLYALHPYTSVHPMYPHIIDNGVYTSLSVYIFALLYMQTMMMETWCTLMDVCTETGYESVCISVVQRSPAPTMSDIVSSMVWLVSRYLTFELEARARSLEKGIACLHAFMSCYRHRRVLEIFSKKQLNEKW